MKQKFVLMAVAFAVGLLATLGYRLLNRAARSSVESEMARESASPPVAAAPPAALEVPSTDRIKQLEAAARQVKLVPAEGELMKSAEVNVMERKLKLATVAARHSKEIPDGEALGLGYLAEMMKNPEEAMKAIADLTKKLDPKEFAVDRAALLDVSALLPGQEAAVRELARSELQEVVPEAKGDPSTAKTQSELNKIFSTDPVSMVPIAAHNALMKASDNAEEALADTEKAIRAQLDTTVRNALAGQDVNKFPQHEAPLAALLKSLGTPVTFNNRDNPRAVASGDKPAEMDSATFNDTKAKAEQAIKNQNGGTP